MQRSRECTQCGEVHLLRANGLMSIHQNARGERCTEPEPKKRQRPERREQDRRRSRPGEKAAAHEFAAQRSAKKRRDPQKRDRFDRSIYATGGVRTVSGGAPGLGRR